MAEGFGLAEAPGMKFWSGSVSVMATAWGANRLVNGQNWLERVEGIGHLALAAETGLEAASQGTGAGIARMSQKRPWQNDLWARAPLTG